MLKTPHTFLRCALAPVVSVLVVFPAFAADIQKPTSPTGLTAVAVSATQVNLSWTASTDDVGVTAYRIFRNGVFLTQVAATTYSNTGLAANTTYTYTVSAQDAAANESAQSASAVVTTVNPATYAAAAYGQTRAGTLASDTAVARFSFTAAAGDKIIIPFAMSAWDEYIDITVKLFDPLGRLVAATNSNYQLQAELTATASAAGSYSIWVSAVGTEGNGRYTFTLQKINAPAGAVAIPFNAVRTGTVGVTALKAYTFTAAAGDKIILPFWSTAASGIFLLRVRVFDSAGVMVGDVTGNDMQELGASISVAGTYTILVGGIDGNGDPTMPGNYALSVQRLNSPIGAIATAYGVTKTGSIGIAALNTFTFTAAAGDQVILPFWSTDGLGNFNLRVRIFNSSGVSVADASGVGAQELIAPIAAAGTYVIVVSGSDAYDTSAVGNYTFTLQRTNTPAGVSGFPFNSTKTGTIAVTAMKAYVFNAAAGDKIIFPFWSTDASDSFLLRVRVFNSAGTKIADNEGSGSQELIASIPAAGTYSVLVSGHDWNGDGSMVGDFSIGSQRLNNPVSATATAYGTTSTGITPGKGLFNAYTFAAAAGDKIIIQSRNTSESQYGNLTIKVVDSAGNIVGSITGYGPLELLASAVTAGRYAILVSGLDGNGIGPCTFEFTLQRSNSPVGAVAIAYNNFKSGTAGVTAMAAYKFTAAAGDKIVIPFGEYSEGLLYTPRFRLFDPAGNKVAESVGLYGELHHTAAAAGVYSILIESASDVPSTYQLLLKKGSWSAPVPVNLATPKTAAMASDVAKLDLYGIPVAAGDNLVLNFNGYGFPFNITLYDAAGNQLAFANASFGGSMRVTAATTGQYFLTVSYATFSVIGTGSYTFSMDLDSITNPVFSPRFFDPAAGQTSNIQFTLARNSNVTIKAYQTSFVNGAPQNTLAGTIFAGALPKGPNTITWNGKDTTGVLMPDSVYVLTLEAVEVGGPTHYTYAPPYVPGSVVITSPTLTPTTLNPYKGIGATITYGLMAPAWVNFKIGQVGTVNVRTFMESQARDATANTESWDGRDTSGAIIPAGSYSVFGWADILPDNSITVRSSNSALIGQLAANPYAFYPVYGQQTNITYILSKSAVVTLVIKHPVSGNVVRTLVSSVAQTAGTYSVVWDGKDASGKTVSAAGNYPMLLTTVDAANKTFTRTGNITVFK